MLKTVIKAFTPPIIQSQVKRMFQKNNGYFSGPYANWATASSHATGYDDDEIIEKVKQATLQVKDNRKRFVRDGIVFDEPQYSFPLLSALLKIAAENNGKLTVVDFGGGLGSKYYAFRSFCETIIDLQWIVIEQTKLAQCGSQFFKSQELSFDDEITNIKIKPDVIVLSGSLQYMPEPYALLDKIFAIRAPYLLLDRTWCDQNHNQDRILVEHVPTHIYPGSYPCWLFSYDALKQYLTKNYQTLAEFAGLEGQFSSNGFQIAAKGIFLGRKSA